MFRSSTFLIAAAFVAVPAFASAAPTNDLARHSDFVAPVH